MVILLAYMVDFFLLLMLSLSHCIVVYFSDVFFVPLSQESVSQQRRRRVQLREKPSLHHPQFLRDAPSVGARDPEQ